MPTASIVVLTHNRKQALADCLGAILEKTRCEYELLVVDNGSTDGTGDFLKTLLARKPNWMRIFTRPTNEGVCARNVALREAQGEYILQVDDDVVVGPGWDEALLAPMKASPDVGAVGQQGFWLNWEGFLKPGATRFLDSRLPQPGDACDLVMGYCWAWRNVQHCNPHDAKGKMFDPPTQRDPIFLYDERFNPHWHEETDLQLQIKSGIGWLGQSTMPARIRCGPVVSRHRSMKSWHGAHNNDPMIGLHHAITHEHVLLEKWGDKRAELGLELDRRGLQ